MKKQFFQFITIALLLCITAAGLPASGAQSDPVVRNIIFMIGDGMGVPQVRLTELFAEEQLGQTLTINSLPYQAQTTTDSLSPLITDSAAAGTALMTGYKTKNGLINILPDERQVYTLAEAAHAMGKSVGLVTTARVTHATPASAFAHVPNRNDENLIAIQLLEFAPEVALGGGWGQFLPNGRKADDRDLVAEMQDLGYAYVRKGSELAALDLATTDRLFGLFSGSYMSYDLDRRTQTLDEPSVADMTAAALAVLDHNDQGFFLMVEGGRIDHAGHAHDPAGVIFETLAFDDAIQVALDYQAQVPDTLVIVTADHETGGLSLGENSGGVIDVGALASNRCTLEYIRWTIKPENALDTVANCGIVLTDDEKIEMATFDPEAEQEAYGAWNLAHYILTENQSRQSGVGWTGWVHTNQPVITYAMGPGAEMFTGTIDNTDVARFTALIGGLTLADPQ